MLARYRKAAAVGLFAGVVAMASWAFADGIYQMYPQIGAPSFCASTVSGVTLPAQQGPFGVVPGSTQGSGTQGICAQTVPAGPLLFTGNEHMPVDVNALGTSSNGAPPATANVALVQLGQGAYQDLTTVTTETIPNNTPFVFLHGAQSNNYTLTMPAVAVEGQIQRVICEQTISGTTWVVANTGQSILGGTSLATCALGTDWAWRYALANTTWYRIH